ncbi:unnamed protein product, partial [Didymodactylos carnosus]
MYHYPKYIDLVPDVLHMKLRIMDVLLKHILYEACTVPAPADIQKQQQQREFTLKLLKQHSKETKTYIKFTLEKQKIVKIGPISGDKHDIFMPQLQLQKFMWNQQRVQIIMNLIQNFYHILELLKKENDEINPLELKLLCKGWAQTYLNLFGKDQ